MSSRGVTFFLRLASTFWLWGGVVLAMVVGQDWLFFGLIFTTAMVALREYFGLVRIQGVPVFTLTGMVCAAVYLVSSFFLLRERAGDLMGGIEFGVLVAFLYVVFLRQMAHRSAEREPFEAMAYTVFGLLYIPWLFNFLTKILFLAPRGEEGATTGQYYLVFLLVVTKFSDMGAYAFGSLFGRHQFVPHVSPNKTWEGVFGAVVSSLIGGYWFYGNFAGKLGALRFEDVTLLGILLGLVAVVGDLAESIIKRSAQVKDSSGILPGIGGTMDLIDSVLFTAPLFYFYLWAVAGSTEP